MSTHFRNVTAYRVHEILSWNLYFRTRAISFSWKTFQFLILVNARRQCLFFCVFSSSSFCVFISSSQSERKALRKSLKDLFTFLFGLVVVARAEMLFSTPCTLSRQPKQRQLLLVTSFICACLDEFRIAFNQQQAEYGNENDEEWMWNDNEPSTQMSYEKYIFIFYVSISSCSSSSASCATHHSYR